MYGVLDSSLSQRRILVWDTLDYLQAYHVLPPEIQSFSRMFRTTYTTKGLISSHSATLQRILALQHLTNQLVEVVYPNANARPQPPTLQPPTSQCSPSQPFLSQPFLSQPFLSQPFLSQPFLSQPFLSQPFLSQPFLSQPFLSQPFLSQPPPL